MLGQYWQHPDVVLDISLFEYAKLTAFDFKRVVVSVPHVPEAHHGGAFKGVTQRTHLILTTHSLEYYAHTVPELWLKLEVTVLYEAALWGQFLD